MFESGNGFIGTSGFFLKGLADTWGTTGVPLLAFWVFPDSFCPASGRSDILVAKASGGAK